MLLSTPVFFAFFLVTWLVYWALTGQRNPRLLVLVAANVFFLARFGALYLLLPLAATVDFLVGLALARTLSSSRQRLGALLVSIFVNLGLLLSTKLIGLHFGDRYAWLLTLSLSFYCFQSLTYTIDLYRREEGAEATRNYLAYLTSALFFPTLVAGPILRLHDFLKQLLRPPSLTTQLAGRALVLIAVGLVKKLLIADYLAENLVTRVFDTPTLYSGLETLAAVYGYALQLFYDFSGYTDIALGVGLLLGLKLPENFNRPYLALNLMDFWRRWHISFSTWLRDYLQEPFQANLPISRRKRPLLSYTSAVIVTFLIGGLWHGIAWTFLVWGALHGVALAIVQIFRQLRRKSNKAAPKPTLTGTILGTLLTFHFVCFTWIFFNASSIANAREVLSRIASLTFSHDNLTPEILGVLAFAALAGVVLLIQTISGRGSATFIYGSF
jgi:D-alanyl-lipoteichoic acid acyltransferase DltB (MBOAT superfamily)